MGSPPIIDLMQCDLSDILVAQVAGDELSSGSPTTIRVPTRHPGWAALHKLEYTKVSYRAGLAKRSWTFTTVRDHIRA